MTGKTHSLFAMNITAIINLFLPKPYTLGELTPILLLSSLASISPDLDDPNSFLGKKLPFLSIPISTLTPHRGFTHSITMLFSLSLVFAIVVAIYPNTLLLLSLFLISFASHILLDAINPSGIMLLYPFSKKRFALPFTFPIHSIYELVLKTVLSLFLGYTLVALTPLS